MRLLFAPTKPAVSRTKRHQSSSDGETINIGTPKTSEGRERERQEEEEAEAMIRMDYDEDLRIWR